MERTTQNFHCTLMMYIYSDGTRAGLQSHADDSGRPSPSLHARASPASCARRARPRRARSAGGVVPGVGVGVVVAGGIGLAGGDLVFVLVTQLLQKKEGASRGEVVRRRLGGDDRLEMAVPWVETTQQVEHLAWLGDGMAKIAKNVGEVLELAAVVVDAHVTLLEGTEFGLDEDGAVHLIVAEEAFDGVPDGEGGGFGLVDEVEDLLVHRRVEPVDDAVVVEDPLGVAVIEGRR